MFRDDIIAKAIEEINYPTFDLTKQFLAVSILLVENENPVASDVIISNDGNIAEVYFPVLHEDYYFVIYLDLKPELSIRFMNTSPGTKVYFYAESDDEKIDKLVETLGFEPTKKWYKGDKFPRNNVGMGYKFSGLNYAKSEKMTGEIEDKLDLLLDALILKKDNIRELSKISDVGINVAYYGYKEQMWGINLKKETIKKLAELDISIDIDLYAGDPDLPDD